MKDNLNNILDRISLVKKKESHKSDIFSKNTRGKMMDDDLQNHIKEAKRKSNIRTLISFLIAIGIFLTIYFIFN